MMNIFTSATKLTLLILILGLVSMTAMGIEITEPMKTVTLMVVSFYFGQKVNLLPTEKDKKDL